MTKISALADSIRCNKIRIEEAAADGLHEVMILSPVYFRSDVASYFRKRGFAVYKRNRQHYVRW